MRSVPLDKVSNKPVVIQGADLCQGLLELSGQQRQQCLGSACRALPRAQPKLAQQLVCVRGPRVNRGCDKPQPARRLRSQARPAKQRPSRFLRNLKQTCISQSLPSPGFPAAPKNAMCLLPVIVSHCPMSFYP